MTGKLRDQIHQGIEEIAPPTQMSLDETLRRGRRLRRRRASQLAVSTMVAVAATAIVIVVAGVQFRDRADSETLASTPEAKTISELTPIVRERTLETLKPLSLDGYAVRAGNEKSIDLSKESYDAATFMRATFSAGSQREIAVYMGYENALTKEDWSSICERAMSSGSYMRCELIAGPGGQSLVVNEFVQAALPDVFDPDGNQAYESISLSGASRLPPDSLRVTREVQTVSGEYVVAVTEQVVGVDPTGDQPFRTSVEDLVSLVLSPQFLLAHGKG